MRVTQNQNERMLYLDQKMYFIKVMSELKMKYNLYNFMKLSINEYNTLISSMNNDERINIKIYQQFIESIMYAMINTKSNIIFSMNKLTQYISDSAIYH